MAIAAHFSQCYVRGPEASRTLQEVACVPCFARFCAGARHANRLGIGFALYCRHDAQLLIARPMAEDQIEVTISGPLSEADATEIVTAANAERQRLAYAQDQKH